MTNSPHTKPRPPVVVVMGHVDHGKTSLLDYIRKTSVAAREAGGITQSIGAYEIEHNGRKITFIDTPGHEAFSKMRSRGADVADLAILVVAADEGVKPQTKEAVSILRETKTPFVVAITKIDKSGADINRVKNELTSAGVLLEGFGGNVSYHGISSKTGEGISDLMDLIILAADLDNLTFNPDAPFAGYILEASRDPRRGTEASVIVKDGVLRKGEGIYTATGGGKVKILENFLGQSVDFLEPSAPGIIIGFEKLPKAGEMFSGQVIVSKVAEALRRGGERGKPKSEKPTLSLVLRAADSGSLEALSAIIGAMSTEDKPLYIADETVGDITDGDVKLAIATGSIVIGFKNKVERGAKNLAQAHGLKIITSEIVYDLVKAVQDFLSELGTPQTLGELEILAVFNQTKLDKQLVGGRVLSGILRTKAVFEIVRDGASLGSGRILSLKEKKTPINQAEAGKEIGILANSEVEIKVGDKIVIKK